MPFNYDKNQKFNFMFAKNSQKIVVGNKSEDYFIAQTDSKNNVIAVHKFDKADLIEFCLSTLKNLGAEITIESNKN